MLQVGFSLPVVQDRMGQESITTTVAVYGHLDRRSMQAAADATALALAGI
jgi:integrase